MRTVKVDKLNDDVFLIRWMHWFGRVLIVVAVVFFILFLVLQSPASLDIASILSFIFFPMIVYGLHKAKLGQTNAALISISTVCWALALVFAARGVIALPASFPLAMLPVIISLPFMSYRGLRRIGLFSLLIAFCATMLTVKGPLLASTLDDATLLLVMVPVNCLSIGLAIFGVWHVGSRLRGVLFDTESSNRALAESERLLEQKVRERTAAVENALAEISEIENIAHTVNVTLDLDEVIAAMRNALQRVFKFDNISVFLLDDERKSLLVHLVSGIEVDLEKYGRFMRDGLPLSDDSNFIVTTLRENQSRLIREISTQQIPEMAPSNRFVYEINPIRSVLFCPLEIEGKAVGVVSFGRLNDTMQLDQQEIDRIQRYMLPLATVIRNARLFDETRKARAEAIESNKAKSQFLANMSHELRTPLNAIIGYSEMLKEDAEDEGHQQYLGDLDKIHDSGVFLLGLINSVLDLTKIEAGKLEMSRSSFIVTDLLNEVVEASRPLFEKSGNQFKLQVSGDLGEMNTDVSKLRQVLLSLLDNAAKFTDKGEVSLEAERESRAGQNQLKFVVRDTGIGMTRAQMDKVFGAFTQADESSSREYGGAGLGLTISREFCHMMGGDISVTSELHKGAVFMASLPAEMPG